MKTFQKLFPTLFFAGLGLISTACIGSNKPRKPIRWVIRSKAKRPLINPELLVPARIKKSNLEFYKQRTALQDSLENPYTNPWQAFESDIRRIERIGKRKN